MSESNKFTPGPWVIIPGGDEWSQGRIATIEPAPETMLEINYWTVAEVNNRRHESAANALLIAAAPDLLEALEAILPFIPRTSASEGGASKYSENVKAADMVRSAIAKARGQQ